MRKRYFYSTTAIFSALGLLMLLLTGCSPAPTLEAPYTQVQKAGVSHIPVGMGRLYVFYKKFFLGSGRVLKLNDAALLGRLNCSDYLYTDLRPGYYTLEISRSAENVLVREGEGVFIEYDESYKKALFQISELKAKQNISDYRLVVSEDSSGIRPMTQAAAKELTKARNEFFRKEAEARAKESDEAWASYKANYSEPYSYDYGDYGSGSGSGSGGIDIGKINRQLERDRFNRNYSRNPDHRSVYE